MLGEDKSGFAEAERIAKQADVAVVSSRRERETDRGRQGHQRRGQRRRLARPQRRPGRPHPRSRRDRQTHRRRARRRQAKVSIRWTAEHVPAIVEAWEPGERGGQALAEILFGDVNPSGRLPVTIPATSASFPSITISNRPSASSAESTWTCRAHRCGISCYGLSYTKFNYSNLRIDPASTGPAGEIHVSADVTNAGDRAGAEVVQLYINDVVSSVTRPEKELKGFRKITLKPGKTATAKFTLTFDELSFLNRTMDRVVEPGAFSVMIGASSQDIRLNSRIAHSGNSCCSRWISPTAGSSRLLTPNTISNLPA